jgi:hypothetical protein
MKDKEIIFDNLPTSEETNFFIKNFESYLKGTVAIESLYKSYPFIKEVGLDLFKKDFQRLRTELVSRKKVKIYTPITVSISLIRYILKVLTSYSKSRIVLEPLVDSSIVAGIKFNLDGKIYNLTLENINSKR